MENTNTNEQNYDQLLEDFIQQLAKDKGIELSDEVKAELVERLDREINMAVLGALPEEKIDELNDGVVAGNITAEQIAEAVEGSGVDVKAIAEQAMKEFREKYLDDSDGDDNKGGEEA